MELPVELRGLCFDRARLLRKLAPTLRRVGPHAADRSLKNRQRTVQRKKLRRALKQNAETIAAYCMRYYIEQKISEVETADAPPHQHAESRV